MACPPCPTYDTGQGSGLRAQGSGRAARPAADPGPGPRAPGPSPDEAGARAHSPDRTTDYENCRFSIRVRAKMDYTHDPLGTGRALPRPRSGHGTVRARHGAARRASLLSVGGGAGHTLARSALNGSM